MGSTVRAFASAIAAIAALAITGGVAAAQAPTKFIAYVNPQALFENAPGRTDAEAQFRKETEGYQRSSRA